MIYNLADYPYVVFNIKNYIIKPTEYIVCDHVSIIKNSEECNWAFKTNRDAKDFEKYYKLMTVLHA
jgi:hypothetical protein